jgi:hypothetical protein
VLVWSHDRFRFPLPEQHRFPRDKYPLLRARVAASGHTIHEAEAVPWELLEAVHLPALLGRIRGGTLSVREQRGLGLPWSPQLVERARRATAGRSRGAPRARPRRRDEPRRRHPPRRPRLRPRLLPVQRRRRRARGAARRRPRRPRAGGRLRRPPGRRHRQIFADDPRAFTLSLHGARNYPFQRIPSDLDVDLPSGTGDDAYLRGARGALDARRRRGPTSPSTWPAPTRGRATASAAWRSPRPGLRARDELVLDRLRDAARRSASCSPAATPRTSRHGRHQRRHGRGGGRPRL